MTGVAKLQVVRYVRMPRRHATPWRLEASCAFAWR